MIIGYNKATNEIAVSDSWGPSYAERWVPVEQMEQVSQEFDHDRFLSIASLLCLKTPPLKAAIQARIFGKLTRPI